MSESPTNYRIKSEGGQRVKNRTKLYTRDDAIFTVPAYVMPREPLSHSGVERSPLSEYVGAPVSLTPRPAVKHWRTQREQNGFEALAGGFGRKRCLTSLPARTCPVATFPFPRILARRNIHNTASTALSSSSQFVSGGR